jgi:hypothetical protein
MADSWQLGEAADSGARLQSALTAWVSELRPSDIRDEQFQRALTAFDKALISTITYMKRRRDGLPKNVNVEQELTDLWSAASRAVSPLNQSISDALFFKGVGWTDPDAWEEADKRGLKIGIEDMQNARMILNQKRQESIAKNEIPSWFPVAGVAFAAVTIAFLMYLLLGPALEPSRKNIFDVLMAFCASASAAFLGGSAVAKGDIPFFRDSPIKFSAFGGIGTLIVVFLILHFAS